MSTDADRYACPQCSEIHERVCARIDAERIAALTAELAEARREYAERETAYWDDHRAAERQLDAERSAHEHTKAKLADVQKDAETFFEMQQRAGEGLCRVTRERDAALADAAAMRLLIGDCHCGLQVPDGTAGRALVDRLAKAEAEAAAMVARFKEYISELARLADRAKEPWLPVVLMAIDQVATKAPEASRALAARVPLWRELEGIARNYGHLKKCQCRICKVARELAALDEGKITCPKCGLVMKPWPQWIGMADAGKRCSCGTKLE